MTKFTDEILDLARKYMEADDACVQEYERLREAGVFKDGYPVLGYNDPRLSLFHHWNLKSRALEARLRKQVPDEDWFDLLYTVQDRPAEPDPREEQERNYRRDLDQGLHRPRK